MDTATTEFKVQFLVNTGWGFSDHNYGFRGQGKLEFGEGTIWLKGHRLRLSQEIGADSCCCLADGCTACCSPLWFVLLPLFVAVMWLFTRNKMLELQNPTVDDLGVNGLRVACYIRDRGVGKREYMNVLARTEESAQAIQKALAGYSSDM